MLTRGSEWRRWEPHIHTPGTVLNNQFGGVGAWETFLSNIETRSPTIEALGVTDYYLTETYEQVRQHKDAGRLPNVSLIFPNIELRLSVAAKTGFVNMHLLVSPEDPNHVNEVRLLLTRLQLSAFGDVFDCTREGLVRLGRRVNATATDDRAALAIGATQFKVDFDQLRKVYEASEWAQANVLIAVAGAEGDGTSGLRQAADATMRQEIEKFAHIIFASSVAQREFWTGERGVTIEELTRRYNGCKPCLHGSDAHDNATVGRPVQDRFTWIKGAVTFDALRQAYIDPAGRAFVAPEPPKTAMPSQVIASVEIENAPWVSTPFIPLNAGLVAIIGARGSGKTALADMIAAGCDSVPPAVWGDHLAFQQLEPGFVIGSQRRWCRSSARLLAAPAAQRLGRTADLCGNRGHRLPLRAIVGTMLTNHAHGAISHLRRKLVPGFAHNHSSFSPIGASGKPGTLHNACFALCEAKGSLSAKDFLSNGTPSCVREGKAQFGRVQTFDGSTLIHPTQWVAASRWATEGRKGEPVSLLWDPPAGTEPFNDDDVQRHRVAMGRAWLESVAPGLGWGSANFLRSKERRRESLVIQVKPGPIRKRPSTTVGGRKHPFADT